MLSQSYGLLKIDPNYNPVPTQSSWRPASPSLASLLDQAGATVSLAHPAAITPDLMAWYIVDCNCDLEQLMSQVSVAQYPNVLESLVEYPVEVASCGDCPDKVAYNDPHHDLIAGTSYQVDAINADCEDAQVPGGERVTIAVVDTEFDVDHPDLVGRLTSVNIDHILRSPATQTESHGTEVASQIIAHQNNGIGLRGNCANCDVTGYPIGQGSRALPSDIRNATLKAIEDGHRIVNLSWNGVGGGTVADDFYAEVAASGTMLTVSAGNDPGPNPGSQTAGSFTNPGIFIVTTATAEPGYVPKGQPYQLVAEGGNSTGPWVDLSGMGYRVSAAADPRFGRGEYRVVWGTSFAAPIVAGVIGSMLSATSCLQPEEIENILAATACSDLVGHNSNYGAGLVDQAAAVRAAREYADNANYQQGAPPVVISGSQVWQDEFRSFNQQVVVPAGATLSIRKSTINFSAGSGIEVLSGGSLNVDGSRLTYNRCGEYPVWNGISMNGTDFRQGIVPARPYALIARSTIEHASTGIADHGYPQPWAANGGEVEVSFSTFTNCKTAVSLFRSDGTAPQVIGNTLTLNDAYPHSGSNPRGISVAQSDVGTVAQLHSNQISDTRADRSNGYVGIIAANASFSVQEGAGPAGRSLGTPSFTNCRYGVYGSVGTLDSYLAEVRGAVSTNTHVSAWLLGYQGPEVINNTFQAQSVTPYTDRFGAALPVQGIRMEFCTRAIVEGNTVTGGVSPEGPTYGIVTIGNQASTRRDVVYNNTLNHCNFGMWSEGNNGGADQITGLCYECNTFNGCEEDIRSPAIIANWQLGIENNQISAAGNLFGSNLMQFAALRNPVRYYSVSGSDQPNPVIRVIARIGNLPNSCLPIFGLTEEDPPCDDVDYTEVVDDSQLLEDYFQEGSIAQEPAVLALDRHTKDYVRIIRKVIDQTDDCVEHTVAEWTSITQTGAPWQQLDEVAVAVYEKDFGSAQATIVDIDGWLGVEEADRLATILDITEDLAAASDEDAAANAFAQANLTTILAPDELDQSYAQALARAAASQQGLANYEPRLSPFEEYNTPDALRQNPPTSNPLPSFWELHDVTIVDILGRPVATTRPDEYLTRDVLEQLLAGRAGGLYFVHGKTENGTVQTLGYQYAGQ
jgi:hypothetical protein